MDHDLLIPHLEAALVQTKMVDLIDTNKVKRIQNQNIPGTKFNRVINCTIEEDKLVEGIKEMINLYDGEFIWFTFPNSTPGIDKKLREHGYQLLFPSLCLSLDLEQYHLSPTFRFEVREARKMKDYVEALIRLFPSQEDQIDRLIGERKREIEFGDQVYFVYDDKFPIGMAHMISIPNSDFSYLYAAWVKDEHRGKGAYSVLLEKRLLDSQKQGKNALTLADERTSAPILQKKGFTSHFRVNKYIYAPDKTLSGSYYSPY
ncbi:MAG: GNAT family N-acetyltransferase [Candidatus Kariarchaeaceae archaeon]|jgi:hypothetical protein